jgi:MOSC domain-containing protein YiiM
MTGTVVSINRSPGGVPKTPVPRAAVGEAGLEGDGHHDLRAHGGPERAVCIYAVELIEALNRQGHALAPGTIGENLTVRGVPWPEVVPGARLRVGGALLEVTKYTTPCHKIAAAFADRDFSRVLQERHPGWSRVYARVLEPGEVQIGDSVELLGG